MNSITNIASILCSIQRALLGKVTPNLRAVYFSNQDNQMVLSFYYDKPLSEEEEELVSLVDTEFIADFPSPDYSTDSQVIIIPYPKKIQQNGHCVYFRYESSAT